MEKRKTDYEVHMRYGDKKQTNKEPTQRREHNYLPIGGKYPFFSSSSHSLYLYESRGWRQQQAFFRIGFFFILANYENSLLVALPFHGTK